MFLSPKSSPGKNVKKDCLLAVLWNRFWGGPGGNTKFVKSLEIRVKNGKQIKISQRSCSKLATIVVKIIVFYSKGGDLEADEPTKKLGSDSNKKSSGP